MSTTSQPPSAPVPPSGSPWQANYGPTQQFRPPPPGSIPSQRGESRVVAHAPDARSEWWKPVAVAAGMFVMLLIGIGIGAAGKSAPSTTTAGQVSAPVAQPPAFAQAPVAQAPEEQPVPVVPQGITAGTYLVGSDIQPGTYKSAGTDGTAGSCYWAREKDTSGVLGSIIANNLASGPSVVTIKPTDGAFETTGCSPWVKIK